MKNFFKKIGGWISGHKVVSIITASVLVVGIALAIVLPITLKHKHEANAKWETSATQHWHTCTGKDCDEKLDLANHTYGEWSTKTEATPYADKVEKRSCTVCGYEETRVVDNTMTGVSFANPVVIDCSVAGSHNYTIKAGTTYYIKAMGEDAVDKQISINATTGSGATFTITLYTLNNTETPYQPESPTTNTIPAMDIDDTNVFCVLKAVTDGEIKVEITNADA